MLEDCCTLEDSLLRDELLGKVGGVDLVPGNPLQIGREWIRQSGKVGQAVLPREEEKCYSIGSEFK